MRQIALAISLLCLVVIGYSSTNADEPKHDIAGLAERVNLTGLDIDTATKPVWYIYTRGNADSRVPGPSDYYLVAAVKLKQIETTHYKELKVMNVFLNKRSDYYPVWMPESIKNYNYAAMGKKPTIYDSAPLVKSSFKNGFLFVTSDNYMYIILSTS